MMAITVAEVLVPGLLTTTNAGGGEIEGFEFDTSWAVGRYFTFNLSAGWLDARYTQLGRTSTISLESTFQLAPERSFSVGMAYERSLANAASISVRADYGWLDRHVTIRDDALQSEQAAYGLVSARVTYTPSANWEVSLFGTNLADEYYQLGGFLARFRILIKAGIEQVQIAKKSFTFR
jgi:iron complex outermembrane receptor protein